MQVTDIEGAMRLSQAAGWNQTEKDWKLLIENPRNVSILAEQNHKIIGTYAGRIAKQYLIAGLELGKSKIPPSYFAYFLAEKPNI